MANKGGSVSVDGWDTFLLKIGASAEACAKQEISERQRRETFEVQLKYKKVFDKLFALHNEICKTYGGVIDSGRHSTDLRKIKSALAKIQSCIRDWNIDERYVALLIAQENSDKGIWMPIIIEALERY